MTGSPKRSKRHHFVPKVLQKQFSENGKNIWYTERKVKKRYSEPEYRNIESAFRIRDYYTVLDQEKPSDLVEREFYGKIDDYLGKALPICIENLDVGKVPEIGRQALEDLQVIVFELLKRTPDFIEYDDDQEIGAEIIRRSLDRVRSIPELRDEQERLERDLRDSSKLVALGRDARVRGSIREPGAKVLEALKKLDVRWAISSEKHSFVLSSKIAHRIGNGGSNGLKNPNAEIWLPISPKYALVLLQDPNSRVPLRVEEGRDHMRSVNEFAVRTSSAVASHSERLLRSLIEF